MCVKLRIVKILYLPIERQNNNSTSMDVTEKKVRPNPSQFDTLANLYEDLCIWPFRQHIEIPNVLKTVGDVRGLSVLDFGSGAGVYTRILKEAGASCVIGYDPSQSMVQHARDKVRSIGLDIEFISELNPVVHDRKFDIVLGVYVSPYARRKEELFEMCGQMGRLVKPGGRLITLPIHPHYNPDPNYYQEYGFKMTPQSGNMNCYEDGEQVELHLCYGNWDQKVIAYYWTEQTLRSALMGQGFRSVERIHYSTSSTGSIQNISDSLKRYVAQPHACILECRM